MPSLAVAAKAASKGAMKYACACHTHPHSAAPAAQIETKCNPRQMGDAIICSAGKGKSFPVEAVCCQAV